MVDMAEFDVTLAPGGPKGAKESVSRTAELTLNSLMELLEQLPGDASAEVRIAAVTRALASALIHEKLALGKELELYVSSWGNRDPIAKLSNFFAVGIAIDNANTATCIQTGLRRIKTGALVRNGEDRTKDIELLIDVILAHYETTQYDEQLLELQEVFYTPTGIPLGSQARIAGRLIVGNRSGTQTLDPDEMAKVLFASNRIDGVPLEEMSEAVRGLVNSHPIAVWHKLLPRFYFDDSSGNDVRRGCTTFLRLCFDEKNPALLLVFDNKIDGNNTWLTRVVDIEGPDTPSREQLWERVRKQGLPCPEIDQADGEDEFFEKHAEARSNSKTWISQYLKVVIIFPAPRGTK